MAGLIKLMHSENLSGKADLRKTWSNEEVQVKMSSNSLEVTALDPKPRHQMAPTLMS